MCSEIIKDSSLALRKLENVKTFGESDNNNWARGAFAITEQHSSE